MTTEDSVATITAFVAAWSRLDPDELASYFTADGCYHKSRSARSSAATTCAT